MIFKNGDEITATDVIDNKLEYLNASNGSYPNFVALITVLTAVVGIRFSSGEPIDANSHKYVKDDKIPIGFYPNKSDLHFQADNIGDSFVITII